MIEMAFLCRRTHEPRNVLIVALGQLHARASTGATAGGALASDSLISKRLIRSAIAGPRSQVALGGARSRKQLRHTNYRDNTSVD